MAVEHYFIKINPKSPAIDFGIFQAGSFKKKQLLSFQTGSAPPLDSLINFQKDEQVLVYIHAMWGQQRGYHKKSLQAIDDILYRNSQRQKVLSIIWHTTHLGYKKSWLYAPDTGAKLATLLSFFCQKYPNSTNLLCHSMGHRIFEGILQQDVGFSFNHVIFTAADLEINFFSTYQKQLGQVDSITVLTHQKDRLLKAANKKWGRERLGLVGLESTEIAELGLPITVLDFSRTKSTRCLEFTNHSYFKTNLEVITTLRRILRKDTK